MKIRTILFLIYLEHVIASDYKLQTNSNTVDVTKKVSKNGF